MIAVCVQARAFRGNSPGVRVRVSPFPATAGQQIRSENVFGAFGKRLVTPVVRGGHAVGDVWSDAASRAWHPRSAAGWMGRCNSENGTYGGVLGAGLNGGCPNLPVGGADLISFLDVVIGNRAHRRNLDGSTLPGCAGKEGRGVSGARCTPPKCLGQQCVSAGRSLQRCHVCCRHPAGR